MFGQVFNYGKQLGQALTGNNSSSDADAARNFIGANNSLSPDTDAAKGFIDASNRASKLQQLTSATQGATNSMQNAASRFVVATNQPPTGGTDVSAALAPAQKTIQWNSPQASAQSFISDSNQPSSPQKFGDYRDFI